MTIVLIGLMVVAFYFLMIRPQRKRQQKQQQTLNQLQPGTKVLLGSGVFGTILRIGDKQAVLEVSPGSELTVLKAAIVRVAGPEDEDNPDTATDTVPESAEPASTLDLKEAEAAADASKSDAEDQTWREYSIPQNDDSAATGPINGEQPATEPAADAPAEGDEVKDAETTNTEVKDAEAAEQGTPTSGPGTAGGPGSSKE